MQYCYISEASSCSAQAYCWVGCTMSRKDGASHEYKDDGGKWINTANCIDTQAHLKPIEVRAPAEKNVTSLATRGEVLATLANRIGETDQ